MGQKQPKNNTMSFERPNERYALAHWVSAGFTDDAPYMPRAVSQQWNSPLTSYGYFAQLGLFMM